MYESVSDEEEVLSPLLSTPSPATTGQQQQQQQRKRRRDAGSEGSSSARSKRRRLHRESDSGSSGNEDDEEDHEDEEEASRPRRYVVNLRGGSQSQQQHVVAVADAGLSQPLQTFTDLVNNRHVAPEKLDSLEKICRIVEAAVRHFLFDFHRKEQYRRDSMQYVQHKFGINVYDDQSNADYDRDFFARELQKYVLAAMTLENEYRKRRIGDGGDERSAPEALYDLSGDTAMVFSSFFDMICSLTEFFTLMKEHLFLKVRLYHISKGENHGVDEFYRNFIFSKVEYSDLKEMQSLVLFILQKCKAQRLKKKRDSVYREQYIFYNGKRYGTRGWRKVCSIKDFVMRSVKKEENFEQWKNLTSGRDMAKRVSDYLTDQQNDNELQEVNQSRYIFSFKNGRYCTRINSFVPYDENPCDHLMPSYDSFIEANGPIGISRSDYEKRMKYYNDNMKELNVRDSCNVFPNLEIDPAWIDKRNDWFENIPTPDFQKILDSQKLGHEEDRDEAENRANEKEIHRMIYAFIGRLLYNVGELDDWQILMFIRGFAGTGKSTILKYIKKIFQAEDVAQVSNNMEKQFGLESIYGRLMWMCLEAKGDFVMNQTDFQSIVSGESVSIARKFKTTEEVENWEAPGIMCGNSLPEWKNNANSISRRVILIDFLVNILENDSSMHTRMRKQLAAFIVKCNRAYLDLVESCKGDIVWNYLPRYFIEKRSQLDQETDSLYFFITSPDIFEFQRDEMPSSAVGQNDNYRIEFAAFQREYIEWCKAMRQKNVNMSDKNALKSVFAKTKLTVMPIMENVGGDLKRKSFIYGIRKKY